MGEGAVLRDEGRRREELRYEGGGMREKRVSGEGWGIREGVAREEG